MSDNFLMRLKNLPLLLAIAVAISSTVLPSSSAASIEGKVCTKAGLKKIEKKTTFICSKSGKKLIWKKQQAPVLPKVDPTPTPTPTTPSETKPAPAEFAISIYAGGPGNTTSATASSLEIPSSISVSPTSDNLKLWIYDPENTSRPLGAPGIFLKKSGGSWTFVAAKSANGIFTTSLTEGAYVFDVVEPNGNSAKYSRATYSITVSASGSVSMAGLSANSQGYFSVTALLITRRASEISNFKASSICQLTDATKSPNMSNAFPRATGRLSNKGIIKALIVPADFTDLPGEGSPADVYKDMAEGTHDFYYKQSKKSLNFEFTTLKEFVHLNIPVSTFNLGSYNGGDPAGFYKAGLAAADPLVDFSKFDVVYVLPPSTVKYKQIAYGPAFPNNIDGQDFQTSDGRVLNGAVGGADAWQTLPGAHWKWMAHETGHLFGLFDWYTLDGTNPYGPWDLMSNNWSVAAIELNAWNRYISGWLSDSQMQCLSKSELTKAGTDYTVEVIGVDSENTKAVTVKISETLVLVMEGRGTAGLDRLSPLQSGLLVYAVNTATETIKGMAKTYAMPGVNPTLDNAPLKAGDSITVEGVTIRVDSFESNSLKVHLSGG